MMETIHIGMTAVAIVLEARVLWRQRHMNHKHAKVYCEKHDEGATTVWTVLEYGYEGSMLRGAFSAPDKATAFAKEQALAKYNSKNWDIFYEVWEERIDAPSA